jgi:hypothetical protein
MTQDEIIQTLHKVVAENQNFTTWTVSTPHLVGLVNHAIAKEREACAKVCETKHFSSPVREFGAKECAIAIRARGEQA